jgi:hypothetical protein
VCEKNLKNSGAKRLNIFRTRTVAILRAKVKKQNVGLDRSKCIFTQCVVIISKSESW